MTTKTHVYNDTRTEGSTTRRQIDPYEVLANAIIVQAVQDYRLLRSGRIPTVTEKVQLNMKKKFELKTLIEQREAVVRFFKSRWYADLTNLSADVLMERLNDERVKRWKPSRNFVVVSAERLQEEIERRMLGVAMLERITGVKGDYFTSIVKTKKVVIPRVRAMKIADGLGIPKHEFILRKWGDKE